MLITNPESNKLSITDKLFEAIDMFNSNNLPLIPIVNSQDKYVGVFDKSSLTKIILEKINLKETVEVVINRDFPIMFSHNLEMCSAKFKSESCCVVLDDDYKIEGIVFAFENRDFYSLLNHPVFDQFLNSSSEGILICDKEMIVRKVNYAYTKLTGVTSDEIVGNEITKIRKGSQTPRSIISGEILKNIYRKEGNKEYFVDIYPIYVYKEIVGAFVVAKDISQIKSLTKKVDEWENKFSKLKSRFDSHHRAIKIFDQIITINPNMKNAIEISKKVAKNDTNIILRGESGTGKDIFAQAIHNHSNRSDKPFVAVNCAAIEPNLVLSELFGYEEGAFTGASKGGKMGLFEIAHTGTLFLDEIGDLDYELQSKLLRVIETNIINRVGGMKNIEVDVRIISATNVNLEEYVVNRKFRKDLYFRLNVIPIYLPPLKERVEDIPYLTEHLIDNLQISLGKDIRVDENVIAILQNYSWPGNIRELQNVLTLAANIQDDGLITLNHIPNSIIVSDRINNKQHLNLNNGRANMEKNEKPKSLRKSKQEAERLEIIKALESYGNTVAGKKRAAQELGISLSTLYNSINRFELWSK